MDLHRDAHSTYTLILLLSRPGRTSRGALPPGGARRAGAAAVRGVLSTARSRAASHVSRGRRGGRRVLGPPRTERVGLAAPAGPSARRRGDELETPRCSVGGWSSAGGGFLNSTVSASSSIVVVLVLQSRGVAPVTPPWAVVVDRSESHQNTPRTCQWDTDPRLPLFPIPRNYLKCVPPLLPRDFALLQRIRPSFVSPLSSSLRDKRWHII